MKTIKDILNFCNAGKLSTPRSHILNTAMNRHTQLKLYHLKPQTLKHVKIIKVSDNHSCDISFGSSQLRDNRF